MALQPPGELGGTSGSMLDPQVKRAESTQGKKRLQQARRSAAKCSPLTQMISKLLVASDGCAHQQVRVTAEELGHTVNGEIPRPVPAGAAEGELPTCCRRRPGRPVRELVSLALL